MMDYYITIRCLFHVQHIYRLRTQPQHTCVVCVVTNTILTKHCEYLDQTHLCIHYVVKQLNRQLCHFVFKGKLKAWHEIVTKC